MTQRSDGRAHGGFYVGFVAAVMFAGGCAPVRFGPAVAYWAERAAVTNAAARHTTTSPYYRFNSALLSDLDDAIACTDASAQRRMAAAVLRDANALSQASGANEIERMPAETRKRLATLAGTDDSPAALRKRFVQLARAALERDLKGIDGFGPSSLRGKLVKMRRGVEHLPDDRGRMARRALLFWGIVPTARGIAREESLLPEKILDKANKEFTRIALWHPSKQDRASVLATYAPIVGVEWRDGRSYDMAEDRIGVVTLDGYPGAIDVQVDPAHPTVYGYLSRAKIHGRLYQQVNYVWWFPDRPAFTKNDVGAGHIDGSVVRITLDSQGRPAIIESSLNCGCDHVVFVSDRLESAARQAFGPPLPGKRFSVERVIPGKHDVVVINTFDAVAGDVHQPLILVSAGYHEVIQVRFDTVHAIESMEVAENTPYRLTDYDTLDALPLGDGLGSMFGPDGLVHGAGREEGYLLAPSGMLSAGQPRKRGTQRIRWDDYMHDDPHLLEKTLRLPPID